MFMDFNTEIPDLPEYLMYLGLSEDLKIPGLKVVIVLH